MKDETRRYKCREETVLAIAINRHKPNIKYIWHSVKSLYMTFMGFWFVQVTTLVALASFCPVSCKVVQAKLQTNKNTWGGFDSTLKKEIPQEWSLPQMSHHAKKYSKRESLYKDNHSEWIISSGTDDKHVQRNSQNHFLKKQQKKHNSPNAKKGVLESFLLYYNVSCSNTEMCSRNPPEALNSSVVTFTLPKLHGSNLGLLMSCSWGQFLWNVPGPSLSSETDMFMVVWSGRTVESTT